MDGLDRICYHSKQREFFIGFSGKASKGVFSEISNPIFSLWGTNPRNPEYGVSEQMQGMASIGLEYESDNSLGLLSAGVFAGVERDRKADIIHKPIGLFQEQTLSFGVLELKIHYIWEITG